MSVNRSIYHTDKLFSNCKTIRNDDVSAILYIRDVGLFIEFLNVSLFITVKKQQD